MKKCSCGFETTNNDFEFCPKCASELEVFTGKRKFWMGLNAENRFATEIEMTYKEAVIVNRVLNELADKNDESWTGSCWISLE